MEIQSCRDGLIDFWIDFCSFKNFSISTSSLLVASSAGLNLPTFTRFLYLLPREGPLILPFSIINRNMPIFCIFFVCIVFRTTVTTRSVEMGNLDHGQDRF